MVSLMVLFLVPFECITLWPFDSLPPDESTICRDHRKFRFFSNGEDCHREGRSKTTSTQENVEKVLEVVILDIFASLRYISGTAKIHRSSVLDILHQNEPRSNKVSHFQNLEEVKERLIFCKRYIRWNHSHNKCIWWSNECSFSFVPPPPSQQPESTTLVKGKFEFCGSSKFAECSFKNSGRKLV